jgi:hypothetical protein
MLWILFILCLNNVWAFDPAGLVQENLFAHPCDQKNNETPSQDCPLLKGQMDEKQSSLFLRPSTYQKTIITGASVSAGYGLTPAKGPTDHFVKNIGFAKKSVNRSMSGGSSRQILNKLYQSAEFSDSSLIIAVDMFFWDTVRNPDCSSSELQKRYGGDAYRKLFQKKLILATVPLFKGDQKEECVKQINKILVDSCKSPDCLLLDGEKLFVHNNSYLMQPDGLHPNAEGNRYMAKQMCRELISKNQN